MMRRPNEESIDLNSPRLSEQQRSDLTEYWNRRYAEAPPMNPGHSGDGSQRYVDTAENRKVDEHRRGPTAPGSRAELVAQAEITRKWSAEAKDAHAPDADAHLREHRAALSGLINYDREHGNPHADPGRDLNKPGEMPSFNEREKFAREEGLPAPRRDVAHPGQEKWRDDHQRQPERQLAQGQAWYVPDHLPQSQAPERKQGDAKPGEVKPFDAGSVKVAQPSGLASALGHHKWKP
jgi:hypothetical protein